MEDAPLVKLAQVGDKEAFGKLIERHEELARRIASRLIANPETARELVQEAFLEAYLSLAHLREAERFKSWLYGIVLNVCRGHLRRQSVSLVSLESLAGGRAFDTLEFVAASPDPQQVVEARELHRLVLEAVGSLSPRNRTATLLFYYDGLSLLEIAAVLGISVGAVKARLHKARNELRPHLLPLYGGPARPKRSKPMVKVSILDVVPSKGEGEKAHFAVVLQDETAQRLLPIWIGQYEGEAIAAGLRGLAGVRPLTFDFLLKIVGAVGATLEEVRIETLKDSTFYAVAKIRRGDTVQEIDARPSDALALAVRSGCPILAAEAVFEQAGFATPATATATPGLDSISQQWQAEQQKWQVQATTPPDEAKMQRNRQALLDYLAGSPS